MFAAFHDEKYQKAMAAKSDQYRDNVIFAGRIANVSRRITKTADDFENANKALRKVKRSILAQPSSHHKKNLLTLVECALWRIIGKRLIHHEDKTSIYFLIRALGRKPEPKKEQGTLCVTVTTERQNYVERFFSNRK